MYRLAHTKKSTRGKTRRRCSVPCIVHQSRTSIVVASAVSGGDGVMAVVLERRYIGSGGGDGGGEDDGGDDGW